MLNTIGMLLVDLAVVVSNTKKSTDELIQFITAAAVGWDGGICERQPAGTLLRVRGG